ncbi:hypothetical protein ACE6H2_026424 [Prunus campanulata]
MQQNPPKKIKDIKIGQNKKNPESYPPLLPPSFMWLRFILSQPPPIPNLSLSHHVMPLCRRSSLNLSQSPPSRSKSEIPFARSVHLFISYSSLSLSLSQQIAMARNEEKAQSMLNRFITLKAEEKKKPKERRPYLASECRDLAEASKWRQQIMGKIGRKVTEIQNEGLGEHRLRDLKDEINKLIREKVHWERRIVELGGPNYVKHAPKMMDLDGNIIDVPNLSGRGPGDRYLGAAKKLPGVRELFEKPPKLR